MNKKLLTLLFVPTFLTTSCGMFSSSQEEKGDDEPKDINFVITEATFTDEEGHLQVNYTCDYDPFTLGEHPFSRLTNFGNSVTELDYSLEGIFTFKTSLISTSIKLEFFDTNNTVYLTYRYQDVTQYDPGQSPIDYPAGYNTLYWHDEFDGEQLDTSKWTYEIGNGDWGWGNNEAEYYTDHNDRVEDGYLHISAKRETVDNFQYTSTRIKTQNKVYFTYGYIEASISLPLVTGMWPAFWMMPNASVYGGWPNSGEIDIMEAKGRLAYQSSSALHYSLPGGGHTYLANEHDGHYIASFHKYAVEWQQDYIKYYIDDTLHLAISKAEWSTSGAPTSEYAPFDKDFYLILNLAVGGHFDEYRMPPESFTSADMVVDYVRVFK